MGWQPGRGDGTGAMPGSEPDPPAADRARRLLSRFANDREQNSRVPSAGLAADLEAAAGAEWRCAGASRDEMVGLLRECQAIESWAAAGKLGVLRALVRDDDQPLPGGGYHGDLPAGWSKSLTHEVALALSMPAGSAERLTWLAWDLQARLPGIGALLATGELTLAKARAVGEAFELLSDQNAAQAEEMIVSQLPGKTYGQVQRLAVRAALAVDPESATRRREDAERNRSRVQLSREDSGAVALSGRDLPTDEALAAHANVCARARQYEESGAFPAGTRMDQFRAAAYLDLLNGTPAEARIACGQVVSDFPADTADPGTTGPGDGGPGDAGPGDAGPGDGPSGGGAPGSGTPAEAPPRVTDLVLPLATLLGLAERPGESHGLGPLDPTLCRRLAVAAVGSPFTRLCVTVTDRDGIAIGHGCAKPGSRRGLLTTAPWPALALPAQVNLTITADRLNTFASIGSADSGLVTRAPPGSWAFTRTAASGPPVGHGSWLLTLPGGRQLTVDLEPLPTIGCDHRHESRAYQPNATLRHLVQVRDYECTFPSCSRHARESDFEHAFPYDKGGRTCACNAGARSRACHQVKQSPGWTVTQPKPGWHQWQTPAGRTYTQGPHRYPT